MQDGKSSVWKGVLVLLAGGILLTAGRRYFPKTTVVILTGIGIAVVLVIALLVFLLYLALKRPRKAEQKTEEGREILRQGRSHLLEIRQLSMRIRSQQIRNLAGHVCQQAEHMLKTLKSQPEDMHAARQFFHYYLPTTKKILSRYLQMEEGKVVNAEETEHVAECLAMVKRALEKQEKNLFANDKLDLSVEMEVLEIACRRDGLLDEDEFREENDG